MINMKNIITSNDIKKGIKDGSMKEIVKGNIKVIEIKKESIYEGKKLTKNGVWRKFTRFNDTSIESAMENIEKYKI